MAKSFTVDVSDKQDRSFYVYVVEGDVVEVSTTMSEGYEIIGSWFNSVDGTAEEATITSTATGYFKTTLDVSKANSMHGEYAMTFTFPREQITQLQVEASDVDFTEQKEVVVAASATPDYPISVTSSDESSPLIEANANSVLTGADDHTLCAAYNRISLVKFAASASSTKDSDGTVTTIYTRTPQEIVVSYADGVVADKNTIDIVASTDGALVDNYVKKYDISDNQSEEKRDYTISNTYISATWRQGPGSYRTLTYPHVWLTDIEVWVSKSTDEWGNEHRESCEIEYRHGTNYGYYITVPYLCSEVHLYGVVKAYGSDSEPASSEIAWNGREFSQQSGTDCDQWVKFDTCQNTTGERVIKKISNSLGGTSYEVPIYLIFEPNPDLTETKRNEMFAEFGGNTNHAGDVNDSVYFVGTGGLYDGVELDDDQEYKTSSNYCYQVSPRYCGDVVKIYRAQSWASGVIRWTRVALLTWGSRSAENESSKFWMNVNWEVCCTSDNIEFSLTKHSQALTTLAISLKSGYLVGDDAATFRVYVRPTKQDAWVSFLVGFNPEWVGDDHYEGDENPEGGSLSYSVTPDPAYIGAEGGSVEFTAWCLNQTTLESSSELFYVDIPENTTTEEITHTGRQWVFGAVQVTWTVIQAAAEESPEPEPEVTYTYEISPETATVGAEGGDVVFTLTRNGSDGSIETATETITIGANTTTEQVTHTGTITLWGHEFTYTIIQEAAGGEEPEPEPEPDPSVTYTYTVSPETASIGADGGTITFTFTRAGSDGSEETQTRDVTITANTTTEVIDRTISITIDDWGYTFSVTVKQDAGTGDTGGDEPDPDTGDDSPDVQTTDGDAHVKYMCMTQNSWVSSIYNWQLFTALTDVDVVLEASDTTDLSCAFAGSLKLVNVREDVFSNCSNALSFAYAFMYCEALKEIPAKIFSWAKQATDFRYAFYSCKSVTSIPETLFQNNTRATDFAYAFSGTGITSIPSGLFANCSKAEDFSFVFNGTKITTAPASLFYSCLNVTSFHGAFSGSTIKEIPGTLFRNNTKVKNLATIFSGCENLTSVGETLFDNCYRAENFQQAFDSCTSLSEIPDGLFKFMTSATNFALLFNGCEKLKTVPSDTFENCISAENFNAAFQRCTGLTRVRDDTFKNCTKVTDFSFVFTLCYNIFYVPQDLFCASDQLVTCNTAFGNNTFLYQTGYNLYHVTEDNVNLFNATGPSLPHLHFLYLWNLTSEGLAAMADFTGYLPIVSTSMAGEAHAYIGKIITDDDRFSKALTGSDAEEIAASTLVRTLLLRHFDRIYVGTCELGSKSFNATGYIETAGVFVSSSRTLTLPSYEDVLEIYTNNGWHSGYDGSI